MSEITVDLTKYPERFEKDTKLVLDKQVNFIFGKNGTGKSTIKEAIKEQYQGTKNILIFDGYDGIIETNQPLNAIALGTDNSKIQKMINEIDKIIYTINENLNPENDGSLGYEQLKLNEEYDHIIGKIETCYTTYASKIKNLSNFKISKTNYDKSDFKKEIQYAKEIEEEEVKKLNKIIKSEKMGIIQKYEFHTRDLQYYLEQTNKILTKSVPLHVNIEDLDGNMEKQNFAKEGLKIHEHKEGEICAFCGNVISEDRRILLQQYFNKEVDILEVNIDKLINDMNKEIGLISGEPELNKDLFYEHLRDSVVVYNDLISLVKNENILFFKKLIESLINKKKNIFSICDEVKIDKVLQNFTDVGKKVNTLIDTNNKLSNNLEMEQEQAKRKLRFNEIAKLIKNSTYKNLINERLLKEKEKKKLDKKIEVKRKELERKIGERLKLVESTKDEEKIAENINRCLKYSGIESFKLKLVPPSTNEGKGQYVIEGHNGQIRSIDKLSKGEKNIIAFLYFFYNMSSPENKKGNKIIIFDDPMSSNDDRLQYLMTSKINEIYANGLKKGDIFLLLTHNIHFYLNVRPYYNSIEDEKAEPEKKFYVKKHYYKLRSIGNVSKIIQINSYEEDYKSNYHELWDDLLFLYKADRKLAMINTCRRILETYKNFNCIKENTFYADNKEAKKLFNVNSHGIEDLEADANGKEKDDIILLLKQVLKKNKGEKHFDSYFPIDIDKPDSEENEE